jgi:hypothetical protein
MKGKVSPNAKCGGVMGIRARGQCLGLIVRNGGVGGTEVLWEGMSGCVWRV